MVDFNKHIKPKIEPYVTIHDVEVDVYSLAHNSVTLEEYKTVRANSPGFEELIPKLNNEALEYNVKHNLENCRMEALSTYDYNLKNFLVPELLKRIKLLEGKVDDLEDSLFNAGLALEMCD